MIEQEDIREWIGVGLTIGGVVTFGYWLYLGAVRKSLEGRMDALQETVNTSVTELRDGLARKVDKEDQRLIDADLKRSTDRIKAMIEGLTA